MIYAFIFNEDISWQIWRRLWECRSRQQKADRMPHIFLCSHFSYCPNTPPTGS